MKPLLPSEAPQSPESWKDIMADVERVIMPGVSSRTAPRLFTLCVCVTLSKTQARTIVHHSGHSLAQPEIPRLLPHGAIVSRDRRRHAQRRHRVHRFHLGNLIVQIETIRREIFTFVR